MINSIAAAILTVAFWYILSLMDGKSPDYFTVFLAAGMGAAWANYLNQRASLHKDVP